MSANNAEPTGEVKDNPDEPILGDNGVNYDSYATEGNTTTQNSAGLNFDSSEYKRRQKTEYFVNVEGAEKRKRAEERRRKIEEKRRIKEIKRLSIEATNIKNDTKDYSAGQDKETLDIIKQRLKADKADRRRSARKRLFTKKFFIILGASVLAVLAIIISYIYIISPKIEIAKNDAMIVRNAEETNNAAAINSEANKIIKESGLDAADNYFKEQYEKASGSDKVYIAVFYSNFIYDRKNDAKKSLEILNSVSDIDINKETENDYYLAYLYIYESENDIDSAKECARKFEREYYEN